jgi:hypothetical protein
VVGSKVSNFTLPPEGEPPLLDDAALSQIPKQDHGRLLGNGNVAKVLRKGTSMEGVLEEVRNLLNA